MVNNKNKNNNSNSSNSLVFGRWWQTKTTFSKVELFLFINPEKSISLQYYYQSFVLTRKTNYQGSGCSVAQQPYQCRGLLTEFIQQSFVIFVHSNAVRHLSVPSWWWISTYDVKVLGLVLAQHIKTVLTLSKTRQYQKTRIKPRSAGWKARIQPLCHATRYPYFSTFVTQLASKQILILLSLFLSLSVFSRRNLWAAHAALAFSFDMLNFFNPIWALSSQAAQLGINFILFLSLQHN